MENKQSKLSILTRGIIKENPVLVLILGYMSDACDNYGCN